MLNLVEYIPLGIGAGVVITVITYIFVRALNQKIKWTLVGFTLTSFVMALVMVLATKFYPEKQSCNIETVAYVNMFFILWIGTFIGMALGAYLLKKVTMDEEVIEEYIEEE